MPEWVHNRAEHILAKNPDMPKSQAFAIATQQGHALGKTPKSYGTRAGRREAKSKYDTPKDDKKTANPGNLESEKMATYQEIKLAAMRQEMFEMLKMALVGAPPPPGAVKRTAKTILSKLRGEGAVLPRPNPAAGEAYARLSRQGAAPGQLFHVPLGKSPYAP